MDYIRFYKDAFAFNNSNMVHITSDIEKWTDYFLKLLCSDIGLKVTQLYYSESTDYLSVGNALGVSVSEVETLLKKSYRYSIQMLSVFSNFPFKSLDDRFQCKEYDKILISELLVEGNKVYTKYITDFKRINVRTLDDLFKIKVRTLMRKKQITGNAVQMLNGVLCNYNLRV